MPAMGFVGISVSLSLLFFFKVPESLPETTTVTQSPFLTEPNDVTLVFENDDSDTIKKLVELECKVGNPQSNQKVSWLKDGRIISDDEHVRIDIVDEYRYFIKTELEADGSVFNLLISPITLSYAAIDSGEYKCGILEDGSDSSIIAVSRAANVRIYQIPRISHPLCYFNGSESSSLTNVSLVEGELVTLSCKSDKGVPSVVLTWYYNEVRLSGTRKGFLLPENSVTSAYAWVTHRNDTNIQFQCQLEHPGLLLNDHSRSNTSCTIGPFEVLYRPDVSIEPKYFHVDDENDTLTLVCNASGNPQVTRIYWSYDGDIIDSNIEGMFSMSDDGMVLTLNGFEITDRGMHEIKCTAESDVGTGTASSIVEVALQTDSTSPGISDETSLIATAESEQTKSSDDLNSQSRMSKSNTLIITVAVGISALILVIFVVVIVYILKARRKKNIGDDCEFDELKSNNEAHDVKRSETAESKGNSLGNLNSAFSEGQGAGGELKLAPRSQYVDAREITSKMNVVDNAEGIHREDGNIYTSQHTSDTTKIADMYANHKKVAKANNDHQREEVDKPSEFEELKANEQKNDVFLGNTNATESGGVTAEENETHDESFVSHPIGPQSDTTSIKKTSVELQYADLDFALGRKQPPIQKKEEPVIYAQIQHFAGNKNNAK